MNNDLSCFGQFLEMLKLKSGRNVLGDAFVNSLWRMDLTLFPLHVERDARLYFFQLTYALSISSITTINKYSMLNW
jgi:hypothetical protein